MASSAYQAAVQAAAQHFKSGRDRKYFLRQMGAEAHFSDLTSPAGAQGYAQIMPATARSWGVRNVHDPAEAFNAAAAHMAAYLRQYGGSWAKALTAYNAGPGRVGGPLPAETRAYIAKVLGGHGDATSAGGTGSSGGGLAATAHTTPASTSTDTDGALVDSLLHSGPVKGSIHRDVLGHALALVQSGAYTTTTPEKTTVNLHQTAGAPAGNASAPAGGSSSGAYPLGRRGKIIGTPYSGTHAKAFNQAGGSDNWQSENAVDISVPIGTPVYAAADGVLGNTGSLGQGGRFAGLRTNLIGRGNSWYYAHMSRLGPGIHAGAHVHKGQLLGYSGEANGVAHLHFAQQHGNPRPR